MSSIEIIGTDNCSKCTMIKNILTKNNIPFIYKTFGDICKNDQEYYLSLARNKEISGFPILAKDKEITTIEKILEENNVLTP